jgi:hypothetical protein
VPLIAAVAVIGALAAFMTLTPNEASAQADTPPGQVVNLMATAYADGVPEEQIELTWEKPETGGRATHYRIDVSDNGGFTWYSLEPDVRNTRFLHAHNPPAVTLQASQERHYRVFAINSFGIGPVSPLISATTDPATKPERPTDLDAMVPISAPGDELVATDLVITLTWDAPLHPDGAPVIGYVLEYSDDGEGWITLPSVSHDDDQTEQTATHPDLNAGVKYVYRVAAYNQTAGDAPDPAFVSGWSNTDSAETSIGDMPPKFVINRTAVTPEAGGIWLYWDMPTTPVFDPSMHPLGDKISGYVVQGRPTATDTVGTTCDVAECPFQAIKPEIDVPNGEYIHSFHVTPRDVKANTDYELEEGIQWAFRLRGLNRRAEDAPVDQIGAIGDNWSEVVNATPGLPTAPQVPQSLSITRSEDDNHGRTGLELTWKKATGVTDADPPVSVDAASYRIEYSDTGPAGDGYNWRALQATYTPSGTEADEFSVEDAEQRFIDSGDDTDLHTTNATKLAAGQERHYRVFAVIGTTMGWASVPDAGTTATALEPGAPELLRAQATGHTEITLSWAPPAVTDAVCGEAAAPRENDGSECGPSVITKYIIEYSEDEGDSWATLMMLNSDGDLVAAAPGKRAMETVTDRFNFVDSWELSPLETRDYRVKVENKARHQSTWSNTATATTPESSPPNEPGGLVAEAYGHNAIKLCWNAQAEEPEDDPVAQYLIEHATSEDGPWMELTRVTAETEGEIHTIHTDDMDLTASTERFYRVTAINMQGPSDQSDVASAMTSEGMVPGMPTGVTATADDSGTAVTVGWTAPTDNGGATITGYKVMWKMSSATDYAADMATAAATATSYQVTGLTASTAYTFKVVATSADGYGLPADEAMEPTGEPAPMLTGPTMVDATVSGNSVTITWVDDENAARHAIILFTSDYEVGGRVISDPSDNSVLFSNLTAGTYIAVVVALDSAGDDFQDMAIGFDLATVPGS